MIIIYCDCSKKLISRSEFTVSNTLVQMNVVNAKTIMVDHRLIQTINDVLVIYMEIEFNRKYRFDRKMTSFIL